jgi:hypothetical protein
MAIERDRLQHVAHFFARHAAVHFQAHRVVPPDAVLAWVDKHGVRRIHQFPSAHVQELYRTAEGRQQLGYALREMLEKDPAQAFARPDVAVQVLLTKIEDPVAGESEALTLVLHTVDEAFSVSLPVDSLTGRIELPARYDFEAGQLDLDLVSG